MTLHPKRVTGAFANENERKRNRSWALVLRVLALKLKCPRRQKEKKGENEKKALTYRAAFRFFFFNIIHDAALVPRSLHRRAHSDDVTRVDRMREVLRGRRENMVTTDCFLGPPKQLQMQETSPLYSVWFLSNFLLMTLYETVTTCAFYQLADGLTFSN